MSMHSISRAAKRTAARLVPATRNACAKPRVVMMPAASPAASTLPGTLAAVEPQGQGAQAAQRQEGLQGAGGGAGQAAAVAEAPGQGLVAGDGDAGQQVGVAADELGGAVHDHVRAEGQGLLQQRRGEGVVDADDRPGAAAGGAQRGKVGHLEQRVGGGLQPEQVRAGDGGLDGRGVGQVNAVDGPAPLLPGVGEKLADPEVAVGRGDDAAPAGRRSSTAAMAAMPEEKATA